MFSYSISISLPHLFLIRKHFAVAHPASQLNSLFGLICRLTPTVCHWPSRAFALVWHDIGTPSRSAQSWPGLVRCWPGWNPCSENMCN